MDRDKAASITGPCLVLYLSHPANPCPSCPLCHVLLWTLSFVCVHTPPHTTTHYGYTPPLFPTLCGCPVLCDVIVIDRPAVRSGPARLTCRRRLFCKAYTLTRAARHSPRRHSPTFQATYCSRLSSLSFSDHTLLHTTTVSYRRRGLVFHHCIAPCRSIPRTQIVILSDAIGRPQLGFAHLPHVG